MHIYDVLEIKIEMPKQSLGLGTSAVPVLLLLHSATTVLLLYIGIIQVSLLVAWKHLILRFSCVRSIFYAVPSRLGWVFFF